MGKILLILGILGILLGGVTVVVSLMLPQLTPNVKMDEALIGVAGGAVLLVLSLLPTVVGLIVIILRRKRTAA